MLKIFDKNHNAIGHTAKYKDCKVESELSTGDKTLSFTYLAKHHNLENEMYVRTPDDEFVIKEVPAITGSFPQIVAILNLEDLQKDMWEKFSVADVTIDEAVRTVLAGTGWRIGECDVTKRRNAGMIQVSTLEVIQNLCTAFMCEPVFDTINKKVSFYSKRGEDKGTYFMSGLNLKKLQKKVTSYDYYTRIIPIGSNGLTIEDVNDGKNYLENYQYSNKILTYIWKDESYTDPQALKEDAELKLDDLSKPEKAYSAEIYNLVKQNPKYSILSYGLGDTIILIDQETETREKQRIVKTIEYLQDHSKDTCEIANAFLTFEEMQQKVQSAAEIINYTITGDGRYTGTINVSDILHFEQGLTGSTTISGINSSIATMQGDLGAIKIKVGEVETNYLKADEAEIKYATIENLDVTNQTVHSIQGDYAEFRTTVTDELSAQRAIIDSLDVTSLTARVATIEEAYIDRAQVNTLLADYATIGNLKATNAQVDNIAGELATYKTVVAGQLTAFDADITNLKAKDAELETALIGTAKITDLEAIRTRTQSLETDVADINTLVNGNLTSDNIHSLVLTGDKVTVENGFIKSAMIESLAADKITGLDINTTKLTVHSENGRSTWTDNTIQISDANRVRVQIGEDAAGDYNLYLWDSAGNLLWNATGVTESGLNDGIIKDVAVADNANIAGSKLDIESVIRKVNGAETTIKGTRIKLDSQNQTLDAAFTSLRTYAEGVNSRTESNETAISVAQGQISTLISNTTIVKDGKTVQLKDAYNSTVADVNSIKTTLNEHTSLIDEQSGEILAVQTKTNKVESDLAGTKQTVSAVQSDLSGTKSRVTTVETGLDGLKTRVANTETALTKKADGTTVDSLTSRVATAETTINGFQASLTATNKTVSDNYAALNGKIDGIDFDGQNLALGTSSEWQSGNVKDITNSCHVNFALNDMNNKGLQEGDILQIGVDLKFSSDFAATGTGTKASYIQGDCNQGGTWTNISITGGNQQANIEKIIASSSKTGRITTYVKVTKAMVDGTYSGKWIFNIRFNYYKGTVYWRNQMVNKGSKPLLWQPAPEDLISEIDLTNATVATHTEQISSHDARITATENSIKLKVSTSDFNSYKTTVNNELTSAKSRLSTAESSITTMKGQIALKVEQTDIDTAVSGIEIGGRNLLLKTSVTDYGLGTLNSYANGVASVDNSRTYNGKPTILVKPSSSSTSSGALNYYGGTASLVKGETYTYSCMIYSSVADTFTTQSLGHFQTVNGSELHNRTVKYEGDQIPANTWTKVKIIFTPTVDCYFRSFFIYFASTSQTINVTNIKLEKGTKATDWTPAPEDVDASITAVDNKFASYSTTTQMQSAIDIAKNSITQSVSETYATKSQVNTVSGNVTTLTSRVTAAEQKLTKDSLVTTIGTYYTTASYVGTAIDGIEIGGRNLIANTGPSSVTGWTASSGWTVSLVDCTTAPYGKAIRATNGTATSGGVHKPPIAKAKMVNGEKYTISAWIRASKACTLNFRNEMMGSNTISVTTAWQKYTFTSTINTGATYYSDVFYVASGIANGMWIEVHSLKLEKGTKTTDWEPAPEDLESSIDSVKTVATQTSEKFNWLVKSGTSATDFTLTDRTATLVANVINLKGLVTFSGLDSAAQSKINTAQSTADTAKNNAATAQSTANTAKNNAATAQSTADTAKANAATAQSTANTAKTNAATAQSTADAAKTAAANAQTTANTANSTANTAKTNAATAQSTADTARAEIASLGKITVKKYDITGASGSVKWIKLGTLVSNGDASNTIITVYSGNGYNGTANQNSQVEIIIKDGWQSTQSAATSFGVSVTRQNCESLTVKVMATAHNTCDVWVYMPWTYWNGMYTIVGSYTSWTHSGANQSGAPTTGTEQNLAYRANAENATTAANLANTTLANWCYNNDKTYINGGKIYTGTIAAAQIAANAVTAVKIASGAITTDKLAAGAVTAAKIAAGTITADKINVTDLFSKNITATGTITGLNLCGGSLIIGSENYSGDYSKISATGKLLTSDVRSRSGYSICYYDRNMLGSNVSEADYKRIIIGDYSKLVIGKTVYLEDELSSVANYTTSCGLTMDGTNLTLFGKTIVKSDASFTSALTVSGKTTLNGATTVNGEFKFNDYSNTNRRPVASTSTDTSRVAFIGSKITSGTYALSVNGQWGGTTFSTKTVNTTTSDIRLKENVAPATIEALPVLNKIGMYQFDWKQDHAHWDVGFVADYLETIDSKFAIGGGYDEDGNMDEKSVNDFYLMGYVVKGVQELCAWNVRSDNQINFVDAKYQSKTASLEAKISSLQYQLQQAFTRIAEQEKLIKQLQAVG